MMLQHTPYGCNSGFLGSGRELITSPNVLLDISPFMLVELLFLIYFGQATGARDFAEQSK